jgi:hypothetical protein
MSDARELRAWMRMAVDLGKKSVSEGDPTELYVGAVIVSDGQAWHWISGKVDNAAFLDRYKSAMGDVGEVEFDYALNGRSFAVQTLAGSFTIQVSDIGIMGVYVYDYNHNLAHVRHATNFSEIDGPAALEFGSYYAPLHVGRIACYALIGQEVGSPASAERPQ